MRLHLLGLVAASVSPLHARGIVPDFPLYFDVGGCSSSETCMDTVKSSVESSGLADSVVLNGAFECPHPCGEWPSYNAADGTTVNNGLPQLANVSYHLQVLQSTFDKYQPNASDDRWVDLDYESWSPIWERNSNDSWYRTASVALVALEHPSWNSSQLEAEAKKQWEASAKSLVLATVEFLREIRPALRIGLYGWPNRYYYNGYDSSTDGDELRAQNDRLAPVWCQLDGLFVSVYQFYNGSSSASTAAANSEYVYSNIAEARRIADNVADPASPYACSGGAESSRKNGAKSVVDTVNAAANAAAPLVLAYTWHRYHDDDESFLEDIDEAMFWEQGSAAGADGLVLWGYEPSDEDQQAFQEYWANDFCPLFSARATAQTKMATTA